MSVQLSAGVEGRLAIIAVVFESAREETFGERLRKRAREAMTMGDGAKRVTTGFTATGGAARGADLFEQRMLKPVISVNAEVHWSGRTDEAIGDVWCAGARPSPVAWCKGSFDRVTLRMAV